MDQFGVLHDGLQPYSGVQDAVKFLADAGMRIVILSNSSRSEPPVEKILLCILLAIQMLRASELGTKVARMFGGDQYYLWGIKTYRTVLKEL